MKKFALLFVIAALLSSSLTFSCTAEERASPEDPMILRLTIPTPPGDKLTENAEQLAQRFSERTNGAYQIKVYPGEQLVKVPETMDAVRTGTIEMASIGLGIFAGLDPGLAEVPMLYNNVRANAAACRASAELYNEILKEKLNQVALAIYTTGAKNTRP